MADELEKNLDENEIEAEKKTASKSNKGLVIGIIVVVILIEGAFLFVFFNITRPPNQSEIDQKEKSDSLKQALIDQTSIGLISEAPIEAIVNVAGTDGSRFLKVVLMLEYQENKKMGEELKKRHPKIKDLLIEQLSTMTLEQINDVDVRNQIRKEFLRAVNSTIPEKIGQVSNVFISEFIIQ